MIKLIVQRKLSCVNFLQCRFSSTPPEIPALNSVAYALTLQRAVETGDTSRATAVHCHVFKRGGGLDVFAYNVLINAYAKSGLIPNARKVFNEMPHRNTVSFVTLIRALSESEQFDDATALFNRLHREGHGLNGFAFTAALGLLVRSGRAELGRDLHGCIHRLGLDTHPFVASALIDAYSVSGRVNSAQLVFEHIISPDLVSWTGITSCCADNGHFEDALSLFNRMRRGGLKPNNFSLASALKACHGLASIRAGSSLHGLVLKTRFESHQFVALALLELYGNHHSEALQVFEETPKDDVIPWSFMIARLSQGEQGSEAIDLFLRMRQSSVVPNQFALASVLQACAATRDEALGEQIHCHAVKSGLDSNAFVSNAIMDAYAKCGRVGDAMAIFEGRGERNGVAWNTVIVGHVQSGEGEAALGLFSKMVGSGVEPTEVTYSSALRACAGSSALQPGLQIHSLTLKTVYDKDPAVGNALLDMYAKCGSIWDARRVFDRLPKRDEVSWNAMISGYSLHGLGSEAISVFEAMRKTGRCKPSKVTLVGVLSACSNAGLLDLGRDYFRRMRHDFGVEPSVEHYTCMIGLHGRVGQLSEAARLVGEIPNGPSLMAWRALLGACVVHKDAKLGWASARRVLEMDPRDDAAHVLLSNLYANSGRWDGVASVRRSMKRSGVRKEPGLSWVETRGKVHCFSAGDTSGHPDSKLVVAVIEWLNLKTRRAGLVPDRSAILRRMDDGEKDRHLWAHSERLALAFGLVRTRGPIRIIKNLRICIDCHAVMKVVSAIVKRDIVVRDLNRYHSFRAGVCSCGDCW